MHVKRPGSPHPSVSLTPGCLLPIILCLGLLVVANEPPPFFLAVTCLFDLAITFPLAS